MKKNCFLFTFIFLSVLCANSLRAQDLDTVNILLKWSHQFEFAGYYAAVEQRYFEEQGLYANLEVERVFFKQVEYMRNNSASYGTSNSNLLFYRAMGMDVVLVAPIFQHSSVVFFTKRSDEILHPQDLKGKKIVIPSMLYPELSMMMYNEGIDPSTAEIDNEWDIDKFYNGEADAILQLSIDLPYMKDPDSIRTLHPLQYGVDFYGECLFTVSQELETNPERALKVRQAVIKGWEYALDNPEEIVDIILEKYNPQLNKADLMWEAEEIRKLILPDVVEIGHNNPGRWKSMYEYLLKQEDLEGDGGSLEGFFLEDYLPGEDQRLSTILTVLGIVVTVLAAFLIITTLVNRRLNRLLDQRLEEIQHRNEELLKMNSELDNFVYRVSHDLRAPISSSMGLLNLIQHESKGSSSEYVDLMQKSLVRLDNFILDILNYSRNSRLEISYEKINIRELANELFKSLFFQNEKIRTEVIVNECEEFISDRKRIYIILNNLLSNAFRYSDMGKDDPYIIVEATCEGESLNLSVIDNGIGVAEEHRQKIFDMFYRAHDEGTGSGLGLYIVKEVVDKLGASLDIRSEEGAGTTVTVKINNPAAPAQA